MIKLSKYCICLNCQNWDPVWLQRFQYRIKYRPGSMNVADALSRLPVTSQKHEDIGDSYVYFTAINATPKALTTKEIETKSQTDTELEKVRQAVRVDQWKDMPDYIHVKQEICVLNNLVLRGNRIVVPRCLRERVLQLAHEGHQGITKCKQRLREKVWWPGIDKEVEDMVKNCQACQLLGNTQRPKPLNPTPLPSKP